MDIRERRNTEKIRLYLVPQKLDPGQGFIMGPDHPVYFEHVLGLSPAGVGDPGGWGDFITTLTSMPDWAKHNRQQVEPIAEDINKIRLYLVNDYDKDQLGYIPGWTPFAANDGSPRLLIALPGAPAPKDNVAFLTTTDSLPDWAERYDPKRSLDHARKLKRLTRRRPGPKV